MRPEVDDFVAVLAEAGFLVVVFVAILSVFKMIITDWASPFRFSKIKACVAGAVTGLSAECYMFNTCRSFFWADIPIKP
jgi:hypothetical protein